MLLRSEIEDRFFCSGNVATLLELMTEKSLADVFSLTPTPGEQQIHE